MREVGVLVSGMLFLTHQVIFVMEATVMLPRTNIIVTRRPDDMELGANVSGWPSKGIAIEQCYKTSNMEGKAHSKPAARYMV